jgi:hypothetical protein
MTDSTCAHCGGTGRLRDPIDQAWDELAAAAEVISANRPDTGKRLMTAATGYRNLCSDRIALLETALRDMLSYASEHGLGTATIFQVTHETARTWKAILDNAPGGG